MALIRLPSGPSARPRLSHPKARQTLRISVAEFCCVLNGCFCCAANCWRTWSRSAANSGLSCGLAFAGGAAEPLAVLAAAAVFAVASSPRANSPDRKEQKSRRNADGHTSLDIDHRKTSVELFSRRACSPCDSNATVSGDASSPATTSGHWFFLRAGRGPLARDRRGCRVFDLFLSWTIDQETARRLPVGYSHCFRRRSRRCLCRRSRRRKLKLPPHSGKWW